MYKQIRGVVTERRDIMPERKVGKKEKDMCSSKVLNAKQK
jgi:hypothetical protein